MIPLRLISNDELAAMEAPPDDLAAIETALTSHIRGIFEVSERNRREIEQEMLDGLRQRNGEYSPTKLAEIREIGGSEIFMMITSTVCRNLIGWMMDLLLPQSGDKAWSVGPTKIPDLSLEQKRGVARFVLSNMQHGQSPKQTYEAVRDKVLLRVQQNAKRRAERMEEKIEDDLQEAGFYEALEAFIDDFATFPSAFMETCYEKKRVLEWQNGQPTVVEKIVAKDRRIACLDVYPSPGQTTINDGDLIVRDRFTRSALHGMIGMDGYDEAEIRMVLEENSRSGLHEWRNTDGERADLELRDSPHTIDDGLIEGLRFWGEAQGQYLLEWGMDPSLIDDPLAEYQIEAIVCGRHVIMARMNDDPLGRRSIYKAEFQKRPGSFWGISVPRLARDAQDLCNGLARAIANNAGLTAGPQVALLVDKLPEGEEVTSIHALKIWQLTSDPNGQTRIPVEFYQPQVVVDELLRAYEYFEQKASEATNIPRYMFGNDKAAGAGKTAQGLAMLLENAAKGLKPAMRHVDRGVIKPRIERDYQDNMLYSDDPAIKGDVNVVPRASGTLIAKAATQARRNEFLRDTANPIDMQILGFEARARLLREVVKDMDMPDLVPDQVQQSQQGPDPKIMAAKINAEARMQGLQMTLQDNERDRQLKWLLANKDFNRDYQELMMRYQEAYEKGKRDLASMAIKERGANTRFEQEQQMKYRFGTGI